MSKKGKDTSGIIPNGRKIRVIRERQGFSQEGLAEKAGYDPKSIGNLERNTGNQSINLIQVLADTLGVPFEEIVIDKNSLVGKHLISFDTYLENKIKNFIGRDWLFEKVDDLLNSSNWNSGYILIQGNPGAGKSAILSKLIEQKDIYAYHFNIATQGINTTEKFLRNLCARLINQYDIRRESLPDDFEEDSKFLSELLFDVSKCITEKNPLIIAIDALDEVSDSRDISQRNNILNLPSSLPEHVYIIATTRNVKDLKLVVDNLASPIVIEEYAEFNISDISAYVEDYYSNSKELKSWAKKQKIKKDTFASELVRKSEGNFMYLCHVLPAIENGVYSGIKLDKLPAGLMNYYISHWQIMEQQIGGRFDKTHKKVICTLAAAEDLVGIDLIAKWTKEDIFLVREILDSWNEFLSRQLDESEKARIYHLSFREFLEQRVDPGLKTYHKMIADSIADQLGDEFGIS
ncbi:MAG: helix-turn-helix domain-containing protein [Phycisphaerae bacterium]|nr:helix-turn-helix domain-containing protein [Phycisphaerae bacterium]